MRSKLLTLILALCTVMHSLPSGAVILETSRFTRYMKGGDFNTDRFGGAASIHDCRMRMYVDVPLGCVFVNNGTKISGKGASGGIDWKSTANKTYGSGLHEIGRFAEGSCNQYIIGQLKASTNSYSQCDRQTARVTFKPWLTWGTSGYGSFSGDPFESGTRSKTYTAEVENFLSLDMSKYPSGSVKLIKSGLEYVSVSVAEGSTSRIPLKNPDNNKTYYVSYDTSTGDIYWRGWEQVEPGTYMGSLTVSLIVN